MLAALETVRTLNDHKITTERPIEIVSWTNEEGARFSPPMIASGVFGGAYALDWALDRVDDDGIRLGDELERIGYRGDAPVGGRPIDAYFELHIEQGPLLHEKGIDVGIVTHGYAAHGLIVEVKGETAHTGPWPMDKRRNALVGASMLAVAAHEIGWKFHDTQGKGTAARIVAWPNRPGILSDWAQFTGDFRHNDPQKADEMLALFKQEIERAKQRANVDMEILDEWGWRPDLFAPECIQLLRDCAARLELPTLDLPSQAGHDAYFMAQVAPTAMIFTPCTDGITHNNNEHATLEKSLPGVNVLINAALARANR
ncbi:MAG: hydantoinase/carbamoylase family amidase [Burkholderiaceae bacterium]